MRIQDLLIESKQDITEAPVGLLKKAGLGIKKVFGSGKAAGELDTGNVANQLKKDYMMMLGKTGQEPEAASVITFLKSKGYPTASAGSALGIATQAPVKKQATQAKSVVKKTTTPVDSGPNWDEVTGEPLSAKAKAEYEKFSPEQKAKIQQAIANEKNPTNTTKQKQLAPNAPNPKGGVGAFDQITKQLTTPTEKPAVVPADSAVVPAAPGRSGGKVKGQVSQTANAIRKRQSRAVKKRTTHPADDNPNIQLGNESIDYDIFEAITDQQLDMAFLKAAQEKAKVGASATATTGATPAAPTKPGFGAMAKAMATPRDGSGDSFSSGANTLNGIDIATLKSAIARAINQKQLSSQELASLQQLLKNLSKEG
jgi:hypothetical protein